MTAQRPAEVRCGPDRFRIGPWQGDRHIAYLAVSGSGRAPSPMAVDQCLGHLDGLGYRSVVTAALREHEAESFVEAGFETIEELAVLRHRFDPIPERTTLRPRRGRRRGDIDAALEVDRVAFDRFWQLDEAGLREAMDATPQARFSIARLDGIAGYAVCGRAADTGYLQRLAVDPDRLRRGVGTALVVDALRWARRRGASSMLVNTQLDNGAADALYRSIGFLPETEQLRVLTRRW